MITYTISVCDELNLIQTSLQNITGSLSESEKVLIQFDTNNGSADVKSFLDNTNLEYIEYSFNGNYGEMKNNLLSNINTPWVFHLDGDEYIDSGSLEINRNLIERYNKSIDGFIIGRDDFNISTNQSEQLDWHLRLFKNRSWIKWDGVIHESIVGVDKFEYINDYKIHHHRTSSEISASINL